MFQIKYQKTASKLSFHRCRERVKRALEDAFNMTVQRKKGMMEQRPKTVKLKVQQMEQQISLQSMKQQGFPEVRTAGPHAEYMESEGKEGAKRWCVDDGMNLVCKQLVKVDNTLLWADVISQEEMMAVEVNEDLMVIPADGKQESVLKQTVMFSLDEDGVNNNVKSPV